MVRNKTNNSQEPYQKINKKLKKNSKKFFYIKKFYYICDKEINTIKMVYEQKITELLKKLNEPEVGEAFEGHPDDPTILEEYYLTDSPKFHYILLAHLASIIIDHDFEVDSNVITIYK